MEKDNNKETQTTFGIVRYSLAFQDLTNSSLTNMCSLYNKIMNDTHKHDFTIHCNDGKDITIPINIMNYYTPYFETLLNFNKLPPKSITVEFSSEDILYIVWYSITNIPYTKEELQEHNVFRVSCEEWIHRFKVIDYFFIGKPKIKELIAKCIQNSYTSDYISSKCLLTLIDLGIDVSGFMLGYIETLSTILYDSKPFDIKLWESIPKKDVRDKICRKLFYNILYDQNEIDDLSLLKFLLKKDIDFKEKIHADFSYYLFDDYPIYGNREGVDCVRQILHNNFDKELIDILKTHKDFGIEFLTASFETYFRKTYGFFAARSHYFKSRLNDLFEVFDDKHKINLIFKEIFAHYLTSCIKSEKKNSQVWNLNHLPAASIFKKYKINLKMMKKKGPQELLSILSQDNVTTADDFYKEYVNMWMS